MTTENENQQSGILSKEDAELLRIIKNSLAASGSGSGKVNRLLQGALPETGDARTVKFLFGIGRGHLYDLTKKGLVQSVSFRERGKCKGRRLWELESIREYLRTLRDTGKVQANEGGAI
jgi:hypothetical protein